MAPDANSTNRHEHGRPTMSRWVTTSPARCALRCRPDLSVKVTRFDPNDSLILVHATIWGPRSHKGLTLAFDTAATQTHIIPEM
jgi:hypothetical protein